MLIWKKKQNKPLLSLSLIWLNCCFSEQLRRKFSQSLSSSLVFWVCFLGFSVLLVWSFCCWFVGLFICLLGFFLVFTASQQCFPCLEDSGYSNMMHVFFHRELLGSWILFWNFWDKCVILPFPIAISDREEEPLWAFLL